MKFVPMTIEVPEHYAFFMREVEVVAPGEWARWAMHIIDQALNDGEHGNAEGTLLEFIVGQRDFDSAQDRKAAIKTIRAAWKRFVQAEVSASVEENFK